MAQRRLRVWLMGLVAVVLVAVIGLGPARTVSFAQRDKPVSDAPAHRAAVLRLAVTEFRQAPVNPGEPSSERKRVERTVLDVTAALPLVEFVLLSGVEALPKLREILPAGADEEMVFGLTLLDGISMERAQTLLGCLKDMKPGTNILLVRVEDDVEIRAWVE